MGAWPTRNSRAAGYDAGEQGSCDHEAMNDDAAAELRALRSRAYGPDADILRDPVAYDRLQELEEQLRSEQQRPEHSDGVAAPVAGEGAPSSASVSASTDGTESAGAAAPSNDDRGSRSGDRAPWSPLTRVPPLARIFWVVSVMAAAALAASATWGVASVPVISEQSGARQIAALDPDPSLDLPPFFGGPSESTSWFQFAGFTLSTVLSPTYGLENECLVVFSTEDIDPDADFINGPQFYGCGAGSFPPIVAVPLGSDAPAEALERFGEGSALQFALQDDRVGVFFEPATPDPVN